MKISEGRVKSINRDRAEITVQFDNNTTETFKLTNRVAREAGRDLNNANHQHVTLYYTNNRGVKEVHYFKTK